MDSVRSDDFAGLLAALGKPSNSGLPTTSPVAPQLPQLAPQPQQMLPNPHPQQFMPTNYNWQPPQYIPNPNFNNFPQMPHYSNQTVPNQALQQQPQVHQQLPVVQESIFKHPLVISLIVVAVLVILVIVWINIVRMNSLPEEDVEEEKDQNVKFREYEQNEPREIPPPSSVTYDDEEVSKYVASNLLNYVNTYAKNEVVDISGQDVPLEFRPPSPTLQRNDKSKRLVADESEEVDAYAKRRAALFSQTTDMM